MEVLRDLGPGARPPKGTALTIGAYDGVHVGHRAVIAEVRRRAEVLGVPSTVVTFDRHPASVVRPESAPRLLTDLDQKLELLAGTGVDRCYVIAFDEASATEPADRWVERVLVEGLGARVVIVGEDFHFGHARTGNIALLRTLGAVHAFDVDTLPLLDETGRPTDGGTKASSTAVRQALAAGDLERANLLLGRPHEVRGTVEHGDGRGGPELGYPTANVAVPAEVQLPADGIYAGWYERPDGQVLATAISLGRRPTFYEDAPVSLLEAHLLDFEGDLYGEAARVRFVARLRGELRFDGVEALVAQIGRDVDDARRLLGA